MPSPLEQVTIAAYARVNADIKYREALAIARYEGHTFEEIAEAAGVTRSAIYQILNPKERHAK
jgi:AcrR family transcriptional regulator